VSLVHRIEARAARAGVTTTTHLLSGSRTNRTPPTWPAESRIRQVVPRHDAAHGLGASWSSGHGARTHGRTRGARVDDLTPAHRCGSADRRRVRTPTRLRRSSAGLEPSGRKAAGTDTDCIICVPEVPALQARRSAERRLQITDGSFFPFAFGTKLVLPAGHSRTVRNPGRPLLLFGLSTTFASYRSARSCATSTTKS
jgi:hypothetical protein